MSAVQQAAGTPVPMVKAERVCKSFGQLDVLKGIDLEVAPREVMCVIGPSGSGKSTFLRCINHLEKINSGRLYVDGSSSATARRAASCTSCGTARSRRSGGTSAWCSSASTCSRT